MENKVKYNGEFKNIDTPEKAYVLGLIYSDGHIGIYNNHYITTICLHKDDLYLLEIIQKLFPFYKLEKHCSNKAYYLICSKKECIKDLMDNGVYQRKSTETKELLSMPDIDESLYSHFIRGYFDGDGSVYKQKQGNTKMEIVGTGFRIITDMIKILYDNRIIVNLRCKCVEKDLRKHAIYILYTSSDKVSKQFANFIYKDCGELYLKRKYEKLYFIPVIKKREKLICPICGGKNTSYNSIRQMKHGLMQRGTCNDCKKGFSIPITAPLNSNIQSGEGELLES